MTYNLTEKQKDVARHIVNAIRTHGYAESFTFNTFYGGLRVNEWVNETNKLPPIIPDASIGEIDALAHAGLVLRNDGRHIVRNFHYSGTSASTEKEVPFIRCTVTPRLYKAVDTNFADELPPPIVTESNASTPIDIVMSLQRFRRKHPDPQKAGFLIMRFAADKPYARIVEAIKETAQKHDVLVVRADDQEFHHNLLGNVRTYLHGCGFGIAIYERITTDEPNANVGFEVGYLMAMNKPVLLLKDKSAPKTQTDLTGELYKEFDPHDPEGTIPAQVTKWLQDYGIITGE